MKIFLTGSSGYIGSNIIKFIPGEYFLYKRNSDIINDLTAFKPDCIIHSAGEIYKNEEMFDSNIVLTNNILQYVKQNPSVKLLYIGSSSEYGKVNKTMSETDLADPYSIYAATKTCGTLLCQAYAREYDLDICIVRPFSIYGLNEPAHRLIPTLYTNIKNNKKVTLIKGEHDFVYILDFVKLLEIVINSNKNNGDIINCGSGISFSNLDVFYIICELMNFIPEFEVLDKVKKQDSEFWQCDTTKLKQKYNFKCSYTFNDGIKEYINYKNKEKE